MKKLFSTVLFIISICTFAQVKLITGAVIIEQIDEDMSPSGVQIENLRSFAKTTSNYNGFFSIPVVIGDTLSFKSSYLVPRKIVISQNLYNKGVLQTHLDIETIQLSEAVVGRLDKDFGSNIKYKRDLKNDLYNQIGLDQRLRDLEPKKDIAKFRATDLMNPLRLIGHMNGYYKKQRKIRNFERDQSILNEVINYFPDEFFIDELKIPDYKVQEFLKYADQKIDIKSRVMNRQFELIGLELEPVAEMYLKELNKS